MSEWVTGAGHIGISVADLDESIEFYEDVLGLKVSTKREKDAFIPLGDSDVLALLQYPGGKEVFNQEAS